MAARRKAGRPRGPKKVTLGLRLPEDLAEELRRTAWGLRAERGAAYGPSAVIEEALREWLARNRRASPAPRARKARRGR
jgi:hypothetical protein